MARNRFHGAVDEEHVHTVDLLNKSSRQSSKWLLLVPQETTVKRAKSPLVSLESVKTEQPYSRAIHEHLCTCYIVRAKTLPLCLS